MLFRFVLALAAVLSLTACEDDKKPAPDAAPTVDSTMSDGGSMTCGTVAYLAACTADDMCESCTCRSFGHSKVCTKTCTGDGDCPAPSGGCSSGFCRP